MNRIFIIVAAAVVVIGLAVMFWMAMGPAGTPESEAPAATVPQQFDTTGGQEMRPRWGAQEEQGNDAVDN